jgi:hypothetical protein
VDRQRIPVWKGPRPKTNALTQHWFAAVVVGAICVAAIFYRYASLLPDGALFSLKLISFALTALLGVVGVVTDFKDGQKNLTPAGKLNLAGLVLAAVIGIVAQRAEYSLATEAATKAQNNADQLIRQNQGVLEQVAKALQPVGDTILVSYTAKMNVGHKEELAHIDRLLDVKIKGRYGYIDKHSFAAFVLGTREKTVMFDKDSIFMVPESVEQTKEFLSEPQFTISFHKKPPSCEEEQTADLVYEWDEKATALSYRPYMRIQGTEFDSVVLTYSTTDRAVHQTASRGVFRLMFNSTVATSAVDFSQMYVTVDRVSSGVEFEDLSILIGQHTFDFSAPQLVPNKCDIRTLQLPKF